MIDQNKLRKYAQLVVKVGANVQEGQLVTVSSPVECKEFARLIVEEAYKAKASNVIVRWNDDLVQKSFMENVNDEVLQEVPEYIVEQYKYFMDKKGAVISISAPIPGLLKHIDSNRMQMYSKATSEKINFFRKFMMSNGSQWTIAAYPNLDWANKVFPDEQDDEGKMTKLMEAIFAACRVSAVNDPVDDWQKHMQTLAKNNKILNEYNFKSLYFKNSLGTDLKLELVEGHIWAGGGENTQDDVYFAPNIPTEETFTMPHRDRVDGKVVATKPLNYQGKLIEDFFLEFKDGKVVNYGAKNELETLKGLIELDEGSSRLGEVALISHNSPISNTNILFYNTLFDENASCHLALGNAYAMNIKNGTKTEEEELIKKGYNKSLTHVDFMFGSSDLEIIGTTYDGKEVQIFKEGNFVF